MEEKELTPRDAALKAIQEGGSVRVGEFVYTLKASQVDPKIKSFKDLPGDEAFIGDDAHLRATVVENMAKELETMKARYEALKKGGESEKAKAPVKADNKSDSTETEK